MAFWGKSFSDIGNLFKTAVGGAIADTNAKLDLSVTKTEKLKAVSSGVGQGFKGIFGSGKINLQEQITKAEEALIYDTQKLNEIAAGYEKVGNKSEFLNKKLKGTSESAKEFSAELVQGKKGTDQFVVAQEQQIASLKATSLSSRAAAVGMKALSIAGNMLVGIGIGLAINLIVTGISKLVNAQKDAIEKANELASSWKEQRNALESNKKTIDSI